ncbi:MAG: hypothetical protein ACKV22_27745 [Bryobacteraceae bacterium]
MNEPLCLYCDKPLTLLSRISGGGKDFCSREHRELYERERPELGLTRLVQSLGEDRATESERGQASVAPGAMPMPDPRPAGFLPALSVEAAQGSGAPRPEDTPRWQTVQGGRIVGRRTADPGLQVETRYLTHRIRMAAFDLNEDAAVRIRPIEFPPDEPRIGYLERSMLRRLRESG